MSLGSLKVDTIKFTGGETLQGIRASANYDQNVNDENYSHNVSSFSDLGTGNLRCTWNNDFASATEYSYNSDTTEESLSTSIISNTLDYTAKAAGSTDFDTTYASTTANRTQTDAYQIINIFGDMA